VGTYLAVNHSSDPERETSLAPLHFYHLLCAGEGGALGEHSAPPDNLPAPLHRKLQKGQDFNSGDGADSHHSGGLQEKVLNPTNV